jgi:aspartyl-tRNA(Asn)/glutamyl-tRNA(Gln) amidotransferase subunit C
MAEFTEKDVSKLADLARLDLSESEKKKLASELSKILDHFAELKEVDTKHVVPLSGGTNIENAFREDVAERTPDTGKGANQFPETEHGLLRVPKILE